MYIYRWHKELAFAKSSGVPLAGEEVTTHKAEAPPKQDRLAGEGERNFAVADREVVASMRLENDGPVAANRKLVTEVKKLRAVLGG